MRLAERLGKTLKQLSADMGVGELAYWVALDEMDLNAMQNAEASRSADSRAAARVLGR